MGEFFLSKLAEIDLDDIWLYIARDSPENASDFIDSLTERFPVLAENPELGRARPDLDDTVRVHPVGSYLILYRPRLAGIEIIRVLHGGRNILRLLRDWPTRD